MVISSPPRSAKRDDDRVVVAGLGDDGAELLRSAGGDLDDVGHEEAGHVEVVDGHVAEDPARVRDVGGGRRLGIAAGDGQLLERADVAPRHPAVQFGEVRIEPTVEAEDDRNRGGTGLLAQCVDAGDVQVDRLLAEDGDGGIDGGADQVDVGRGRRGDDDGVDVAGVEDLRGIGGHSGGAVLLRGRLRALDEGIADPVKGGLGQRRHTRRVHLADPAGAHQSDLQLVTHLQILSVGRSSRGRWWSRCGSTRRPPGRFGWPRVRRVVG